jgi:hypothetical protein
MALDPICGMQVNPQSSVKATKEGVDYFFCSTHCRDKFIQQEGIKDTAACCSSPRQPFYKHKLFILTIIVGGLLAASLFLPSLGPFRKAFLLYLKSIWWAVLLGLFLGGIIDYYIPREYISKVLARKSPKTILNAVLLGFLMSACSHGILALAIQIHKKGASNPAIVSFLLASPWANPAITIMLISLFGLKGVLIIIAAIVVAINTGFIFMFLERKGLIEKNKNIVSVSGEFSIIQDVLVRAKHYRFGVDTLAVDGKGVLAGARALADMVLWWILLGVFISSLAGAYIPTHFFHKFMGPTVVGLLVTLALATVIEVCSEGSSPLAFEIYRQTGALGNSFVFLMAGVATDYTEIGLLWSNVGRRVALWLPVISVPQIVALGYLMNSVLK